jgi:hypothetical protein
MSLKSKVKIIDVYNNNLSKEIQKISYLIEKYPVIAMVFIILILRTLNFQELFFL